MAELMDLMNEQCERLVGLGVPQLAGLGPDDFRAMLPAVRGAGRPGRPPASSSYDDGSDPADGRTVLVVHPTLVPAARLATLLHRDGKDGFVVEDMTDLAEFAPTAGVVVPDSPLYVVHDVDRGDDMRDWSPNEAVPALRERGRRPLTVSEGISWLLQDPAALEPNHCFMTAGSRKHRPDGNLDARTPALWISGGTGRDGAHRKGAPKVGWCWANNRHTWLGFGSTTTTM